MKTLVTGGAGYIGSHLSNQLLARGHDVIVYDDFSTGFHDSLDVSIQVITGDIRDSSQLNKTFEEHKIEAVVHCAAKISVEESIVNPELYHDVNSIGTNTLVRCCIAHGVNNFIFSSTAAVYGEVPTSPVNESYPCSPINPYGHSKLLAENDLKSLALQSKSLNYIALRYFNVVGASADGKNGQRYDSNALFPMAASAALGLIPQLTVNGTDYNTKDGSCIRDYIHIDDLVDAHILALEYIQKNKSSEILNCGYGTGYSVLEVLKEMKKISEYNFEIIHGPRRPKDPTNVIADNRLIREKLGWIPKFNDLNYLCKSTYDWKKKWLSFRSEKNN